ncbi:nucleoside/nucleotide kinase family protein [Serratia sp. T13T92]|uniref:nucleoside/nucleotide kinase family protein n=1 Tax=Serratia TaxID=613 RepID=UPI000EF4A7B4|nr:MULTISPECIES: nucleoside/nucleotide kinase family protein [Serratia]AYM90478.1 nucleoside/nucleotide kinase family protein [Serratia sp. 3ACOL1]MBL5861302.1 nucleoside/nucleotide kinase family protein [Serratia fonticola]
MKIALTVNGLTIDAFFTDEEVELVHLPLLRLLAQKQQQKGGRLVVFLAAPPGSGKSTLTAFWQHLSAQHDELPALQTLPMDGFHRPNSWLDAQGLRSKKGMPETFDRQQLELALASLDQPRPFWPTYDRVLHDPVPNAIEVTAPVTIVEGNWLLLDDPGWRDLARHSDLTLFIQAPAQQLRARLIERKMRGGSSLEQASTFYQQTDGPNVDRVLQHSLPATITLQWDNGGLRCSEESLTGG